MFFIIYNIPGILMAISAFAVGSVLGAFAGHSAAGVSMIAGGIAAIPMDLLYRFKRGRSQWVSPSAGGHLFFIPVWILGCLWLVCGVAASQMRPDRSQYASYPGAPYPTANYQPAPYQAAPNQTVPYQPAPQSMYSGGANARPNARPASPGYNPNASTTRGDVAVAESEQRRKAIAAEMRKQAEEQAARDRERKGPDPSDPAYLEKMADRMLSENITYRDEAIRILLQADPATASPEAKKKVARAFKNLAEDSHNYQQSDAIQGLVKWAGRFSVPILLKILNDSQSSNDRVVIDALVKLNDPRAAPALAARLKDYSLEAVARDGLTAMGSDAEDAVIAVGRDADPRVSLIAINLLGDIGTEKSFELFRVAQSSRDRRVRAAALAAQSKIKRRKLEAKSQPQSE